MIMSRLKSEYALYKGDVLLDIGTLDELQEKYKVKRETLYFYQTPAHKKREKKGNLRVLVKLD